MDKRLMGYVLSDGNGSCVLSIEWGEQLAAGTSRLLFLRDILRGALAHVDERLQAGVDESIRRGEGAAAASVCGFDRPWQARCANARPCAEHSSLACWCGAPAVRECEASRGLMCGTPLCAAHDCMQSIGGGPHSERGQAQYAAWSAAQGKEPST